MAYGTRKGLKRKYRKFYRGEVRGKAEELERKARFFAALPQKMRPDTLAAYDDALHQGKNFHG
jgi:hypothetical protein